MMSRLLKLQLFAATGISIALISSVAYYIYLYRRRRKSHADSLQYSSDNDSDYDRSSNSECDQLWIIDDGENSGEQSFSPEAVVDFEIAMDSITPAGGNEAGSFDVPVEYGYCETELRTSMLTTSPALSAEVCCREANNCKLEQVVDLKRKPFVESTDCSDIVAHVDNSSAVVPVAKSGLPPRPFRRRKMISLISNIVKSEHPNRLDETTACSLVKLLNDHEHSVILQSLVALKSVSTTLENQVGAQFVVLLFQSFPAPDLQVLLDSFNVSCRIRVLLEANTLSQNALVILADCISNLSSSVALRAKLASCIPQLIHLLDLHIRSGKFRDACLHALLNLVDSVPDGNFRHHEMLVSSLLEVFNPDGNNRTSELAVMLLAKLALNFHTSCLLLKCKTSHPDVSRFLTSKNETIVLNLLILLDFLAQAIKSLNSGHIDNLHDRSLAVGLFSQQQLPVTRQRLTCLLKEHPNDEIRERAGSLLRYPVFSSEQ